MSLEAMIKVLADLDFINYSHKIIPSKHIINLKSIIDEVVKLPSLWLNFTYGRDFLHFVFLEYKICWLRIRIYQK